MSTITKPILLDETGKEIKAALEKIKVAIENGGGGPSSGAVRYDEQQELSEEEKKVARENIGAADGSDLTELHSQIGDPNDLQTEAKKVVDAINEVKQGRGGGDYTLLKTITLTEDAAAVNLYSVATDGAYDNIIIEMISPSVAGWNTMRTYLNNQFGNITRYGANLPYFISVDKYLGRWKQTYYIPYTNIYGSYVATGVGGYGQILSEDLSTIRMTLYQGLYPAGATFKVYVK